MYEPKLFVRGSFYSHVISLPLFSLACNLGRQAAKAFQQLAAAKADLGDESKRAVLDKVLLDSRVKVEEKRANEAKDFAKQWKLTVYFSYRLSSSWCRNVADAACTVYVFACTSVKCMYV